MDIRTEYRYAKPLSVREAADWAGISTSTIYRWVRAGLIGRKVGRTWMISQSELAELAFGKGSADENVDR